MQMPIMSTLAVEFRITSFKKAESSNPIQPPGYHIENLSAVILNRNKREIFTIRVSSR